MALKDAGGPPGVLAAIRVAGVLVGEAKISSKTLHYSLAC